MTPQAIDQKPSETALFTALRRTIAHLEYANDRLGPDFLAEKFLPPHFRFFLKFKKIQHNTREKLAQFIPGMNEYIIARTAFFDDQFMQALKNQTPQIVLLGAGYDSRPYRFAGQNRGSTIFELDAAPTQDRKLRCLKAVHIDIPMEVRHVPINFRNEALGEVLEKAGYQKQEKTFFLWEGVTYYLDRDAVNQTLEYMGQSTHPENIIAFDYTVRVPQEELAGLYGAEVFAKSMQEQHAREEILFSVKPGEIETILTERGLRMLEHLDAEAIEQKYLRDENGALIGRMTGIFRFVSASPRQQSQ
jgi:methyltransferase (TIGR00027 family)